MLFLSQQGCSQNKKRVQGHRQKRLFLGLERSSLTLMEESPNFDSVGKRHLL